MSQYEQDNLSPNLTEIAEQAEEKFIQQDNKGKGGGTKKTSSGTEAYKQTAAYQEKKRLHDQKKELYNQLKAIFEPGKFKGSEIKRQQAIQTYVNWLQLVINNYNKEEDSDSPPPPTPQIDVNREYYQLNKIQKHDIKGKQKAGGQNVNKVSTGVRLEHLPTGISARYTKRSSQVTNLSQALDNLAPLLQAHLDLFLTIFPTPTTEITPNFIKTFISSPPKMPKN